MTLDIPATYLGVHDILWAPISGEKRLVRVWSQDEADLDGDRNQPSRFFSSSSLSWPPSGAF